MHAPQITNEQKTVKRKLQLMQKWSKKHENLLSRIKFFLFSLPKFSSYTFMPQIYFFCTEKQLSAFRKEFYIKNVYHAKALIYGF